MIRVTRVLEYVYADQAAFEEDQARWQLGISKVSRPNPRVTIRSAMLPPVTIPIGKPGDRLTEAGHELIDQATDHKLTNAQIEAVASLFGLHPS